MKNRFSVFRFLPWSSILILVKSGYGALIFVNTFDRIKKKEKKISTILKDLRNKDIDKKIFLK